MSPFVEDGGLVRLAAVHVFILLILAIGFLHFLHHCCAGILRMTIRVGQARKLLDEALYLFIDIKEQLHVIKVIFALVEADE